MVIAPNNAVIFHQGARQTRVSGPAIFRSSPFEYVKKVVDLRRSQETRTIDNVLTLNSVPVQISIDLVFGIDIPKEARLGDRLLTLDEQQRISTIEAEVPNWRSATYTALEKSVRQVFADVPIRGLFSRNGFERYEQRILPQFQQLARAFHVRVHRVSMRAIEIPPDFASASTLRWIAQVEAETTSVRETARAAAMRDALRLIAEGYSNAKGQGMTAAEVHREILRRTIEGIASDPAAKIYFTSELQELGESLRQSPDEPGRPA